MLAVVGTLTTGVLSVFMAVNAMVLQDGTSAGLLLIAAAVAFGSVTIAALRTTTAGLAAQRPAQNSQIPTRPRPPLRIHE